MKKNIIRSTTTLCAKIVLCFIISSQAYSQEGPPKPPKEAIDACSGKTDRASCSFVTPNGDTINGSCRKGPPEVNELACGPSNDKPHPAEEQNEPNEED